MKIRTEKFLCYNFLHRPLCSCFMHNECTTQNVAEHLPLDSPYSTVVRRGPVLVAQPGYSTVHNVQHFSKWLSWTFKRSQLDHILIQHNELDYICCILALGWFPGFRIVFADVSEHSVSAIFVGSVSCLHHLWRWNRQSVPKCQHIKLRRRGITRNK